MTENWDVDAKGDIVLSNVMGYETMAAPGGLVLLRVQFARDEASFRTGGEFLQVAMPALQSIELAKALLMAAQPIPPGPPPPTRRH